MAEGEGGGSAAAQNGSSTVECAGAGAGAGAGAAKAAAESSGAVATEAVAEGAGVGAIDAANCRSNHAFCSAKSLRISSRRSWVEGFMVPDRESMALVPIVSNPTLLVC
jgi:hypothetical protein